MFGWTGSFGVGAGKTGTAAFGVGWANTGGAGATDITGGAGATGMTGGATSRLKVLSKY